MSALAPTTRRRSRTLGALVALLLTTAALAGCGKDDAPPTLTMPDLVGKPVSAAINQAYDALHTSLVTFDLSPLDRESATDWVVVGTSPAAGEKTPKFTKVYAWALKASEYRWFTENPTMPTIRAGADVAKLVAKGGVLAGVKDLVQIRYQPGKAPAAAKASPVDAAAFTPDRGLYPDLATEPEAEWQLREGLLEAPAKGTVTKGTQPSSTSRLRTGQLLVLLVIKKPAATPATPASSSGSGSTGGSSGGTSGGSSGGGGGGSNGPQFPSGIPTKIPNCPRQICG